VLSRQRPIRGGNIVAVQERRPGRVNGFLHSRVGQLGRPAERGEPGRIGAVPRRTGHVALLTPRRRDELDLLLVPDAYLGRTSLAWLGIGPTSSSPAAVKAELGRSDNAWIRT
jgi:hypothetical protein